MIVTGVNLWAVLVAAVASMVVGFLWYSPFLFARPWMLAMGYDPDNKAKLDEMRKSAGKSYALLSSRAWLLLSFWARSSTWPPPILHSMV